MPRANQKVTTRLATVDPAHNFQRLLNAILLDRGAHDNATGVLVFHNCKLLSDMDKFAEQCLDFADLFSLERRDWYHIEEYFNQFHQQHMTTKWYEAHMHRALTLYLEYCVKKSVPTKIGDFDSNDTNTDMTTEAALILLLEQSRKMVATDSGPLCIVDGFAQPTNWTWKKWASHKVCAIVLKATSKLLLRLVEKLIVYGVIAAMMLSACAFAVLSVISYFTNAAPGPTHWLTQQVASNSKIIFDFCGSPCQLTKGLASNLHFIFRWLTFASTLFREFLALLAWLSKTFDKDEVVGCVPQMLLLVRALVWYHVYIRIALWFIQCFIALWFVQCFIPTEVYIRQVRQFVQSSLPPKVCGWMQQGWQYVVSPTLLQWIPGSIRCVRMLLAVNWYRSSYVVPGMECSYVLAMLAILLSRRPSRELYTKLRSRAPTVDTHVPE
jgi:hypothetical protein